ncbi:conserved hypothetical protein [Candida dubliniensis CD36]|uniref:Uncharacterized protein n=1 Tax=Candida dubliniensis (strain CD36 / ATCC MYA-646 / CBS 7987 / NCPF 3949 / NRRL Y-17841) TaxID=573826 RepID=B9WMF3_CANDC|nr:conserved hypothetical protein [Candida dubliniensis CD36]CAX40266.1 conserved hypothetical protein [Candida dubliniensis CD36]
MPPNGLLENGSECVKSFNILDYPQIVNTNQRLFLNDTISSKLLGNIVHPLVFNGLLSLTCCYFECNAYKSFSFVHNYQIRLIFHELHLRFYLISIRSLKDVVDKIDRRDKQSINDTDDLYIGLIGSILLNYISLYDDSHTSFAFSNGIIQLSIQVIESARKQHKDNFREEYIERLILASKSSFFPSYSSLSCLVEFKEMLDKFRRYLVSKNVLNNSILSSIHSLNQFVSKLMGIYNTNNNINNNPKLLKHLLREWLLILPTSLYLFNNKLSDNTNHNLINATPATTNSLATFAVNYDNSNTLQYEIIVTMYYEALSKLLDNFFPKTLFYNLYSFGSCFTRSIEFAELDSQKIRLINLQIFSKYCLKVCKFFKMRFQLLNNLLTNNFENLDQFSCSVNEVPINRFNNHVLKPINFLHFPESVQLSIDDLQNINRFIQDITNNDTNYSQWLYNYNHHHLAHFRTSFYNDAQINFHGINMGYLNHDQHQKRQKSCFGYVNTLFKQYSQLINKHLQDSYSDLFSRDNRQQQQQQQSLLRLSSSSSQILQQQSIELLSDYEPVYTRLIEENGLIENNLSNDEKLTWIMNFEELRKQEPYMNTEQDS